MSSTAALEAKFDGYRSLVARELREVVGGSPLGVYGWMRYHLGWESAEGVPLEARSGKLLRPVALLLAAEGLGGAELPSRAAPAAAAVELVHNFSLLHDDIEDASEQRHARATLWTVTGVAQAINTGDGMYTVARVALHGLRARGFDDTTVLDVTRELDEACMRLVEGQFRDMDMEGRTDVDRARYLAMTEGKTAAMFAAPFAMGARLGGGDPGIVAALRSFGRHVGLAFQAADDLLGIWGDPSVTGKPASDDLRARKMTLPVIAALEAGGDEAEALAGAYSVPAASSGGADDEAIAALAATIERLGGREATEALAAAEVHAALEALASVALPPALLEECAAFASLAATRAA